jgi:truncated hemoglobin YjbI
MEMEDRFSVRLNAMPASQFRDWLELFLLAMAAIERAAIRENLH